VLRVLLLASVGAFCFVVALVTTGGGAGIGSGAGGGLGLENEHMSSFPLVVCFL
jgi:hypothetical protein